MNLSQLHSEPSLGALNPIITSCHCPESFEYSSSLPDCCLSTGVLPRGTSLYVCTMTVKVSYVLHNVPGQTRFPQCTTYTCHDQEAFVSMTTQGRSYVARGCSVRPPGGQGDIRTCLVRQASPASHYHLTRRVI